MADECNRVEPAPTENPVLVGAGSPAFLRDHFRKHRNPQPSDSEPRLCVQLPNRRLCLATPECHHPPPKRRKFSFTVGIETHPLSPSNSRACKLVNDRRSQARKPTLIRHRANSPRKSDRPSRTSSTASESAPVSKPIAVRVHGELSLCVTCIEPNELIFVPRTAKDPIVTGEYHLRHLKPPLWLS